MSENAKKDIKQMTSKMEEVVEKHMEFLEEDMIKNKFSYVFYDRLQEMSNIFIAKSESIQKKYKEIVNSNKNKIKSEILVQDKFLEYNDNIDNIIRNLDKNIMNADEFIIGRIFI